MQGLEVESKSKALWYPTKLQLYLFFTIIIKTIKRKQQQKTT